MIKIKNKEDVIYEFDPVIYPRKIWITVGCNKETLNLIFPEGYGDDQMFTDMGESADAVVYHVRKIKPEPKGGILLCFKDKEALTNLSTTVHECNHVASEIYSYIGARHDVNNQEPFAYLAGFVGECVSEVIDELKD